MFERVKRLCEAPGIPGRERAVMDLIEKELDGLPCHHDALGNLLVTVSQAAPNQKTILLEAHADRIGLLVTGFLENGFLRVTKSGGIDTATLMGAAVEIEGVNGTVTGIVGAPFPHPAKPHNSAPASEYKMPEIDALYVDTGLANPKEKIKLGAACTIQGQAFRMLGSRVAAPALDNRLGCAALIEVGQRLAADTLSVGVALLFATREEVGCKGAPVGAFDLLPDEAIAVDTAFGLSPDTSEKDCSKLGAGPELGIAPLLSPALIEALQSVAAEQEIPLQTMVFGRATGTDADSLAVTATGIPTALLSIPIRYMHHPLETADLADLEATVELLCAYVRTQQDPAQ